MRKLGIGRKGPKMDKPSHTRGVKQGNATGSYESQEGHLPDGRSTARRSTGINPSGAEPIDPRMPNLSPG